MTEINRQPIGLSDFLQVQAGGRNPDRLSETIIGVLDALPFYAPDRWRGWRQSISASVGAPFDAVEVPEGEAWLLLSVALSSTNTTVAGQTFQSSYWIERIPGQGLNGIQIAGGFQTAALGSGANATPSTSFYLPNPILVTAGQRIVHKLDDTSYGTVAGEFMGTYYLIQSQ